MTAISSVASLQSVSLSVKVIYIVEYPPQQVNPLESSAIATYKLYKSFYNRLRFESRPASSFQVMTAEHRRYMGVPDYVDDAAQSVPDGTWAIVPLSTTSVDKGWQNIAYGDLAKAVNNLAWWIENNIGVAQNRGQTIGYMGYSAIVHSSHAV